MAALVVALFAVLLLSPLPADVKRLVSGIGLVGAGLAAGGELRLPIPPDDRAAPAGLVLFGVAALLATLSNLLLLIFGYAADRAVSPSDIALLALLLVGIAGIVIFPLARRRGTDLARMVLDGIVIGGSVLFIASVTLFPQILQTSSGDRAEPARAGHRRGHRDHGDPAVPARRAADRPVLGLAAAGFACNAVSDFAYAVLVSQTGTFTFGSIVDLGWIAGYTLIALAVRTPGSAASPHGERPVESSPVLGTAADVRPVLVAGRAQPGQPASRHAERPRRRCSGCIVLLAVLARQILLVVDNERLRKVLEQQVIERSRSLRQVAQQSDLLVNSVGDGIYGVDQAGLITFVNPAAARVLGLCAARPDRPRTPTPMFHADAPDGSHYPADSCYITEAIRDRVVTNAEEDSYLRADGLPIPVEVTATPLIVDGEAIGAVVVFRDVTQRREVDRLKSEFVSMVSHELRTPLTAIRGSLGLIAGGALGSLTPAASRMVDIALLSSERLTRLINEILDIERIESGVLPLDLAAHPRAGPDRRRGRPGADDRRGGRGAGGGRARPTARSTPTPTASSRPCSTCSATPSSSPNRARSVRVRTRAGAARSSSSASPTRAGASPRTSWTASSPGSSRSTPPTPGRRAGPGWAWPSAAASSRSSAAGSGPRTIPTGGASFRFTLPVPADQEAFEPVTTQVDVDRGRPARLEPTR